MKHDVYNLQFPDHIQELVIANYIFRRVHNYSEQLNRLSAHVREGGEYQLTEKTGEHAITAIVECPSPEISSPLGWAKPMPILQDILLLLSLFSGREVFSAPPGQSAPIGRDSRPLLKWETLGASLPMRLEPVDGIPADVSFAGEIEKLLRLVHSEECKRTSIVICSNRRSCCLMAV